jgi:hypothetical protein
MIKDWTVTRHAIDRALDMAVTGESIRKAVLEPEGTWQGADPNRELRWHGRVCVAVDKTRKSVVTVMWNTGGKMSREDDDELFWRDA